MQYLGTGGDYSNTGPKKRLKKRRRRKSKLGNGKLGKRQQADKAFHAYDEYLDGPCDPKIYDCEGFSYEEYDPNNGDDRCETPWIFLTTGCYRFEHFVSFCSILYRVLFFNCSAQISVLKIKTLFNQRGSFVHREFHGTESLIGCPLFFIVSKLEVAPNAIKMLDGVGEWMDGYPLDCYDY